MSISSQVIKDRLFARHGGDICVEEALIGRGGSQRFDFWTMKPTWTAEVCQGYEIKVSRSDFLKDNKWQNYLPFCTEFYFVCPSGLILPEELPEGVGLLWCAKTGGMLFTKRKARHQDIPPENLALMLRHVLMWRYERTLPRTPKQILVEIETDNDWNRKIKASIERQVIKKVGDLQKQNESLKHVNENLEHTARWLKHNDIDPKASSYWRMQDKLDDLKKEFDKAFKEGVATEATKELLAAKVAIEKVLARLVPKPPEPEVV